MRLSRRIIGALAATAVVAGLISSGATATAAVVDETTCEAAITQKVAVPDALVERTCAIWVRQAVRSDGALDFAPTLVGAWTDVGVFSADATVAGAGWPISATCLLTGVVTGPSTAYYVLVGIAHTTGPATSTTVQCSASPAGLTVNQTLPGPAAVGADFTTTLFPGSALTKQSICSYGVAYYPVRPLTMRTNTLPCSPL